eukprot:TRINITY_DN36171_c0_g1_i1.p1 TRINITY_DN36171_c0_g1~~TRINITY_DN36171_c0_g1_i1.p1  ORF type:complete len:1186 (+),score=285.15 TRINITY_DN36171_c0_g1_i1:132-3689(+)
MADSPERQPSEATMDGKQAEFNTQAILQTLRETGQRASEARMNSRKPSAAPDVPQSMLGADVGRVGEINVQLRILEQQEEQAFGKGMKNATAELAEAAACLDIAATEAPAGTVSPSTADGIDPGADAFIKMMQEKMREQQAAGRQRLLAAQQKLHQNASRLKNLQMVQESKEKQLALVLSREQVTTTKLRRRVDDLQMSVEQAREKADVKALEATQVRRELKKLVGEYGLNMRQFQFKLMRELHEIVAKRDCTVDVVRGWVDRKQQNTAETQYQGEQQDGRVPPDQDPDLLHLKIDKLERSIERLRQQSEELQVMDRVKSAQIRTLEEKLVELTEKCRSMVPAEDLIPLRDKVARVAGYPSAIRTVVEEAVLAVLPPGVKAITDGVVERCAAINARMAELEEKLQKAFKEQQKLQAALQGVMKVTAGISPVMHQLMQCLQLSAHGQGLEPLSRVPYQQRPQDDEKLPRIVKDLDRECNAVAEIVGLLLGQKAAMKKLEEQCAAAQKEVEKAKAKHIELEQRLAKMQAEAIKEREKVQVLEKQLKTQQQQFEAKIAAAQKVREKLEKDVSETKAALKQAKELLVTERKAAEQKLQEAVAAARNIDVMQVCDELRDKLGRAKDKSVVTQVTHKMKVMLRMHGVDLKEDGQTDNARRELDELIATLNERGIMLGKHIRPGLIVITAEEQAQMDVWRRMDLKEKHSELRWRSKVACMQTKNRRYLEQQLRVIKLEESVAQSSASSASQKAEQLKKLQEKREVVEAALEATADEPPPPPAYEPDWVPYSMPPAPVTAAPAGTSNQLWGRAHLRPGAIQKEEKDVDDSTRGAFGAVYCAPYPDPPAGGSEEYLKGRLKNSYVKKLGGDQQLRSTLPARLPTSRPTSAVSSVEETSTRRQPQTGAVLPAVLGGTQQSPPPQVSLAARSEQAGSAAPSRPEAAAAAARTEKEDRTQSPASGPPASVMSTVALALSGGDGPAELPLVMPESAARARVKRKERREIHMQAGRGPPPALTPLVWAGATPSFRKTALSTVQSVQTPLSPASPAVGAPSVFKGSFADRFGGAAAETAADAAATECKDCEEEGEPTRVVNAEDGEASPRVGFLPDVAAVAMSAREEVAVITKQGLSHAKEQALARVQNRARNRFGELVPRARNTRQQLNSGLMEPPPPSRQVCFTLTSSEPLGRTKDDV